MKKTSKAWTHQNNQLWRDHLDKGLLGPSQRREFNNLFISIRSLPIGENSPTTKIFLSKNWIFLDIVKNYLINEGRRTKFFMLS